jgi:small subunit ribosomal protein S8
MLSRDSDKDRIQKIQLKLSIFEVHKMTTNDTLAACLSRIDNAEKVSKDTVIVGHVSSMIKSVLSILQKNGYIGDVKVDELRREITISLPNQINSCGVIKPRFKVKVTDIEQRYLPAKSCGLLIISTPKGLMTNQEAKQKKVGGCLIAYCY